jgi:hypothetical protein
MRDWILRLSTSLSLLLCFAAGFAASSPSLAGQNVLASDQAVFLSQTGQYSRSCGTPIGPPPKVTICYQGHSIKVPANIVSWYLNHGARLGPCSGDNGHGGDGHGDDDHGNGNGGRGGGDNKNWFTPGGDDGRSGHGH